MKHVLGQGVHFPCRDRRHTKSVSVFVQPLLALLGSGVPFDQIKVNAVMSSGKPIVEYTIDKSAFAMIE
jgi:hypothetical protein